MLCVSKKKGEKEFRLIGFYNPQTSKSVSVLKFPNWSGCFSCKTVKSNRWNKIGPEANHVGYTASHQNTRPLNYPHNTLPTPKMSPLHSFLRLSICQTAYFLLCVWRYSPHQPCRWCWRLVCKVFAARCF